MTSLEEFRLEYAEFDASSDALVSLCIRNAARECSVRAWGIFWLRGVLTLAAHMLALKLLQKEAIDSQGAIGLVSLGAGGAASMSTGRESISYGAARQSGRTDISPGDALLTSTVYGQEHIRLKQRLYLGPVVL